MLACPAGWGSATCVAGGSLFFVGLRPGECSGLLRAARGSRPAGGHFLLLAQEKVTKEKSLEHNIRSCSLTPVGGPVFLRTCRPPQLRSTGIPAPTCSGLRDRGADHGRASLATVEVFSACTPRSRKAGQVGITSAGRPKLQRLLGSPENRTPVRVSGQYRMLCSRLFSLVTFS